MCHGTGDIVCNLCDGSGKLSLTKFDENFDKYELEEDIRNLFDEIYHDTIIGPVKIDIEKIERLPNVIKIFPDINNNALIHDNYFDQQLKEIAKHYNSPQIIIPSQFYE